MIQPPRVFPPAVIDHPAADAVRQILDHLAIPPRLEVVRDSVWRGGEVRFLARLDSATSDRCADVAYELIATWETAILDSESSAPGLVARGSSTIDGRWVRRPAGYRLRIGIEVATLPNALYLHGLRLRTFVPFVGRSDAQIARTLDLALDEYASAFLDTCLPVPEAQEEAAHSLRRRGL